MSYEMNTTFTPEGILEQAQGNANALFFVSMAYLKEHNLSMDQFWAFAGNLLAPGWEDVKNVKECAKGLALNMVSFGVKLHSLSGDESQAKVVLGGWPSKEALVSFGITQEEADTIWGMMGPITESLGFSYECHRQGDEVTLTLSR